MYSAPPSQQAAAPWGSAEWPRALHPDPEQQGWWDGPWPRRGGQRPVKGLPSHVKERALARKSHRPSTSRPSVLLSSFLGWGVRPRAAVAQDEGEEQELDGGGVGGEARGAEQDLMGVGSQG